MRRTLATLGFLLVASLAAAPAQGGSSSSDGCGLRPYAYAGLQAMNIAHGVSATLSTTVPPAVTNGHVGGWVGLGGTGAGPGGKAEWIQTGLAAFTSQDTSQMYYEVTVAGSQPRYKELGADIGDGISHRFAVLEIAHRRSWWRVWVDGRPVSPPIFLPGSDGRWYPQAVAENWNGDAGACNSYSYRFSNVDLAAANGGAWQPFEQSSSFQDPGYHVVPISATPRTFVAASLAA